MEERKLTCDVMYFLGIGGIGMSALARYLYKKRRGSLFRETGVNKF